MYSAVGRAPLGTSRLNKASPRPACSPVPEWTRRSLSSAAVTWLLPAWAFLPEGWDHGRSLHGAEAAGGPPAWPLGGQQAALTFPRARGKGGRPPRGGFALRIISLNTQKWKDLGKNLALASREE